MKPILFNTEMVRAILDGRKSVTRRVVKSQPIMYGFLETHRDWKGIKPPYRPGDILYVRETWAKAFGVYWHKAGLVSNEPGQIPGMIERTKWHQPIHMSKEAARIFLYVTDVRAERLQDITEEQARAEGVSPVMVSVDPEDTPDNDRTWHEWGPALPGFVDLWDSTIKKADLPHYGWDANPWVWVIEFERISKEEALKGGEGNG